jgi:phytoene synthase
VSPDVDDLDAEVRRADPNRWLSSRFIADPAARADVVALYAFDHQLERAGLVASNSLIAEIRLTWWREFLDEAYGGGPVRAHPVARRLAAAIARHALPRTSLEAMIDARLDGLDRPRLGLDEATAWADAVAGSAARLAAVILDPGAPADAALPAGRIWGLRWLAIRERVDAAEVAGRIRDDFPDARRAARRLGAAAFPAVAHATLARAAPGGSDLGRRVRLLLAVASGLI